MNVCVRHILCVLLAVWLSTGCWPLCCANASAAEETFEPRAINTTATPPKNEIESTFPAKPAVQAKKVYPTLPADVVYDVVKMWREADSSGKLTALPSLNWRGEGPAGKAPDWRFPNEESGLVARPAPPAPSGAEPENARFSTDGDDSEKAVECKAPTNAQSPNRSAIKSVSNIIAAPKKSVDVDVPGEPRLPEISSAMEGDAKFSTNASARFAKDSRSAPQINPVDPEAGRFIDSGEALEQALPNRAAPVAKPVVIAPAVTTREESPRIESGSGLDRDDPKTVVPLRAAALDTKLPAGNAVPAPTTALDPSNSLVAKSKESVTLPNGEKLTADVAPAAGSKWKAKDTLADEKKPDAKGGAKAKGPIAPSAKKEVDPEEQTAKLLKEIKEKTEHLAELTREAQSHLKPVVNPQSGQIIRDAHASKVYSTMTDENRPVGAVVAKIFDAKTKQPLAARVKLVDMTEVTARAPLSSGFCIKGVTPPIKLVSGLVRAEINHGGRFFPTLVKGLDVIANQVLTLEVPVSRPPELDFASHGWILADLDLGIRKQEGENSVWFGAPPTVNDLILGAKAEGVRVVGVSLPLGDDNAMNQVHAALENPNPDVLLIPVFPGPRNLFNGAGSGLGVTSWEGLKASSSMPEIPLREGFDAIRERGGLAVFNALNGLRKASIESEILPFYRRLKESQYFAGSASSQARLYSAAEFPFDTVTGAYDVLAFDGSDEMETVWFNLLNEGAPVRVIGAGGGSLEGGRIPFGQTFLQIDGKPTRDNVMSAIADGRTMVSFGPAVFCKVFERDMGPGSVLPTDGRSLHFQIRAFSTMAPGAQVDKVEIIRNGKVIFSQAAAESEAEIQDLRWPMSETGNAWYVVRVTERLGHQSATSSVSYRRAWTSPIYFRNSAYVPPEPCVSHIHGTMRRGLTPVRGVVTALATGTPTQRVESGPDGSFSIALPSTGTLIFEAPGCEPMAKRIFEHPHVQNGIGKLMASEDVARKLADRPVFGLWRLLLSDLDWDIALVPSAPPLAPEPMRIPEPQ